MADDWGAFEVLFGGGFVGDEDSVSFDDAGKAAHDLSAFKKSFVVFLYTGEEDMLAIFAESVEGAFANRYDFVADFLQEFVDFQLKFFDFIRWVVR